MPHPAPFRVRVFSPPTFRSVIPTGVADFFFRSRRASVGHEVEGPWRHLNLTLPVGTTAKLKTQPRRDDTFLRRVAQAPACPERLKRGGYLPAAGGVLALGDSLFPLPDSRLPTTDYVLPRIEMHLSIRGDRDVSSTLQELHYFLPAPCHCRPTGFRLGILFQSPQVSSVELKIDLPEFSLCCYSNRKALLFEQYRLPVFDERLLVDSQERVFEG